jgi:hypothetical protein
MLVADPLSGEVGAERDESNARGERKGAHLTPSFRTSCEDVVTDGRRRDAHRKRFDDGWCLRHRDAALGRTGAREPRPDERIRSCQFLAVNDSGSGRRR